ncbi:hypothetical protein, partial [Mycobacterium tuberculosis]|uniref:hypothetical protein n=1 Tax=Mycobacterium tuberculosis TaxID=1773 RepID=UPI0013752171
HGSKADPENARGSGVLAGDVDDLFVIRTPRRDDEEKAADVDGVELDEDEEVPAPIQGCRQLRLFHKVHREAQCPTINLTMMPIELG